MEGPTTTILKQNSLLGRNQMILKLLLFLLVMFHLMTTPHPGLSIQFSSVSQSCPTLYNPMTARQASLSITNSRSSLRLISIESVMPSSHLVLGRPLLLLPPIPPSIRAFSNESTVRMRWPKYWSFSFSIIASKEIPGLILGYTKFFFPLLQ